MLADYVREDLITGLRSVLNYRDEPSIPFTVHIASTSNRFFLMKWNVTINLGGKIEYSRYQSFRVAVRKPMSGDAVSTFAIFLQIKYSLYLD